MTNKKSVRGSQVAMTDNTSLRNYVTYGYGYFSQLLHCKNKFNLYNNVELLRKNNHNYT